MTPDHTTDLQASDSYAKDPVQSSNDRWTRYYVVRWSLIAAILLLVVIEPVSHVGLNHDWADQAKFYQALTAALHGKANELVDEGWVGSGYVAAAVILNRVVSIRPEDTLVLLNRLCYFGTIVVVGWFVMFIRRPSERDRDQVQLFSLIGGFGYLLCVIHANGLTFFSDIPWSHFVSSFLIVLTIALVLGASRLRTKGGKAALLIAAGTSLGLLAGTRLFDGLVVGVSLAFAHGLSVWQASNRRQALRAFIAGCLLIAISGLASFLVCVHLSGAQRIPLFYLSIRMDPALKKIYPSTFLAKAFQLFVDPSFDTSNHPFTFRGAAQKTWSPSINDWKMPLLLQAPILLYAFALLIPVAAGTFIFKRKDSTAEAASLRTTLIIAIALLIGYTTTFVAGSPNLISGMIRDYMPVIWCLVIVGAPSASWLWIRKPSPRIPLLLCAACVAILLLDECATAYGVWPTYSSRHIAHAVVTPSCHDGNCVLSLAYVNPQGRKRAEKSDMLLARINCAGSEQPVVLVGPDYHFHECPGAIDGVILPRLSGLAAQPIEQVPFSFTFKLSDSGLDKNGSRTYLFGAGNATHSLLVTGWSDDEHGFVWTDAKQAEIDVPVQPYKPGTAVDIDLELIPLVGAIIDKQRVILRVNDQSPQTFVLVKSLEHIDITHVMVGSGDLKISLSLPDAASPLSIGTSSDARLLGVALHSITLSPASSAGVNTTLIMNSHLQGERLSASVNKPTNSLLNHRYPEQVFPWFR
jgi:hypothetical protein